MKIKRIIAGMAAAVMAATMCITASAKSLFDTVDPESDDFYSIGAMGFYMSQEWNWNQGEWCGISEDGVITVEYSINEALTDKTLSGQGTLGDMGIMICNVPEEGYPYNMKVTEATFTPKGGDPITLQTVLDIKGGYHDAETGIRIHIRPTDNIDDEGYIVVPATPEVKDMDQPGNFKGGVLKITVDFKNAPEAPPEPEKVKAESANADAAAPADGDDNSPKAGAAAGGTIALFALAGSAVVIKRRK
ncbi:MAG: hypothetical protein IKP95_13140 [Ruminococcus sp.]|nr:hypothetical protein [Ruminococcus sp.]